MTAAVLPSRAGYLFREGSVTGFRRAVQAACTRWGGISEPIVPVKDGGEIDAWRKEVDHVARAEGVVNIGVPDDAPDNATHALGLTALPRPVIHPMGPLG